VDAVSAASSLVAGDSNDATDTRVRDCRTWPSTRVSLAGPTTEPNCDCDAARDQRGVRCVAVLPRAAGLVGGDADNLMDV